MGVRRGTVKYTTVCVVTFNKQQITHEYVELHCIMFHYVKFRWPILPNTSKLCVIVVIYKLLPVLLQVAQEGVAFEDLTIGLIKTCVCCHFSKTQSNQM